MTNFEKIVMNYQKGLWTDSMLEALVNKGKLSVDEYIQIVGVLPANANLEIVQSQKIADSKNALVTYLEENPLVWIDGNKYSVTEEKQALLTSQISLYQMATTAGLPYTLKWNTTGGECTEWTIENLSALALAIGAYVQPMVSYQQAKEIEISNCTSVEEVNAIVIDYSTVAGA